MNFTEDKWEQAFIELLEQQGSPYVPGVDIARIETTYNQYNQNIFWDSFEKMKRDCKKIMRKFLNGMTLKEIASTMALSYVYVRKKKHYCYKSLLEHVYANQDFRQLKYET